MFQAVSSNEFLLIKHCHMLERANINITQHKVCRWYYPWCKKFIVWLFANLWTQCADNVQVWLSQLGGAYVKLYHNHYNLGFCHSHWPEYIFILHHSLTCVKLSISRTSFSTIYLFLREWMRKHWTCIYFATCCMQPEPHEWWHVLCDITPGFILM